MKEERREKWLYVRYYFSNAIELEMNRYKKIVYQRRHTRVASCIDTYLLEVLNRLGDGRSIKPHLDSAGGVSINVNIEKDSLGDISIFLSKDPLKQTANHVQIRAGANSSRWSNRRKGLDTQGARCDKKRLEHHDRYEYGLKNE